MEHEDIKMVLKLTGRQLNVLKLIAEGYTAAEIGQELFISKRTAETIRSELIMITQTKNTASLITFAFRNGLLA